MTFLSTIVNAKVPVLLVALPRPGLEGRATPDETLPGLTTGTTTNASTMREQTTERSRRICVIQLPFCSEPDALTLLGIALEWLRYDEVTSSK